MRAEAEVFPVDTDDLVTAKKIKIVTVLETETEKKVFINYTTLIGRVNKIEWCHISTQSIKQQDLNNNKSYYIQ